MCEPAAAAVLDGRHPSIYLPGSGNVLGYFEKALTSRGPSPEPILLDLVSPPGVEEAPALVQEQLVQDQGQEEATACPLTPVLDQAQEEKPDTSTARFRDKDRQSLLKEWQEKKKAKAATTNKKGRTPLGTLSHNRLRSTGNKSLIKQSRRSSSSGPDRTLIKKPGIMGPPDASKENTKSVNSHITSRPHKAATTTTTTFEPTSRLFPMFVPTTNAPSDDTEEITSSPPIGATEKMFPMVFSPPESATNKRKRNGRKKTHSSPTGTATMGMPQAVEGATKESSETRVVEPSNGPATSLADFFTASTEERFSRLSLEAGPDDAEVPATEGGDAVDSKEAEVMTPTQDDTVAYPNDDCEGKMASEAVAQDVSAEPHPEETPAINEEEVVVEKSPVTSPSFSGSREVKACETDKSIDELPRASKEQLVKALDDLIVLEQVNRELENDKYFLAAALAERDEEAAKWEQDYVEAKTKVEDLQGLLEKAKGEIVGLKEQLSKATKSSSSKMKGEAAEKKELQMQLARREKEVAELRAELKEARDMVRSLEANEKQMAQINQSQMAFCNSQQEKLVATQQMLCNFQTRADGERQRLEQELELERHRRRAFEDLANSVLRAMGLCGLNPQEVRPDNPDSEKLIQQRVSELASSVADRVALEKQVAHQADVIASREKRLAELQGLEEANKEQAVTIKRLQESNREIQREHGAAVLLAKKSEKEANNLRDQVKQVTGTLAEVQGRVKTLEAQLSHLEQEKIDAEEEAQEAMARLRASEDEVQSLERKLTVTKDELTMIKDQLGPETQALRQEVESLRADLTQKHEEEHKLRSDLKRQEAIVVELRKGMQEHHDIVTTLDEERRMRVALQQSAHTQEQERAELLAKTSTLKCQVEEYKAQARHLSNANERLADRARHLEAEAERHEVARRVLHNQVVELKGNIRVFVRVRPTLRGEPGHSPYHFLDMGVGRNGDESRQLEVIYKKAGNRSGLSAELQRTRFSFDQVFSPEANQSQIFSEVQPLIQSAIDGYKVCIFAYGQTGSGKTFTMMGPDANTGSDRCGLTYRATDFIFDTCARLREKGWQFRFMVEMVEIYLEKVRDLLSDGPAGFIDGPSLEIRHRADESDNPVPGLTSVQVGQACEVTALLSRALAKRCTKATQVNVDSSRSHLIFTLKIEGTTPQGNHRRGTLHLIDLAGSERLSQSGSVNNPSMLEEAKSINSSLSALSEVISALYRKDQHVPYRNSKLTSLLRHSLGGDCKCLMMCNLSPSVANVQESLCSLRFASKVHGVITSGTNGQGSAERPPSRSSSPSRRGATLGSSR